MRFVTYIRALLVRLLFACHGVIAIWRMFMVTRSGWSWYLCVALVGLGIETVVTICRHRGREWKWFCPSVFFYLLSVVPAIWFLELYEIDERIKLRYQQNSGNHTNITEAPEVVLKNQTKEALKLDIEGIGHFSIPIAFSADLWLRVLEQFLLLMLIVGRWILPKGSISHDQLSQLLLVYVGTAADIVEFYEAFSEDEVKYNRLLCYIILGIWTLSLLQFTMVLTATKARRDQIGLPMQYDSEPPDTCCNPELYGILTSIMLQDLPFLCVRLTLIFYYRVVSYTNMFFTSKNTLVIILLIYRLIVVHAEASKRAKKHKKSMQVSAPYGTMINGHKVQGLGKNGKRKKSNNSQNLYMTADCNTLPKRTRKNGVPMRNSDTTPAYTTLQIPTVSKSETMLDALDTGYMRRSSSPLERR